jgi:hypothetical protein
MMAASLLGDGSDDLAAVSESGREAVPAPSAELSRTRVAISSGTPFPLEGCAEFTLSGRIIPFCDSFAGIAGWIFSDFVA